MPTSSLPIRERTFATGYLAPGHFPIDARYLPGRIFPAETGGLRAPAYHQLGTKFFVEQQFLHTARDVKDVFRIDLNRGVPHYFRQGTYVGHEHRRAGRHRLQGRETKTFVE